MPRNSIYDLTESIAADRRAMHENPQTSYEEEFASNLVAERLTEWGIPFERGIAVTGIVATIEGEKTDSGKVIGLRADMDALDIIEASGQPWSSKIPGKMHGCGHDGHTAMLLGAAKYLNENRNFNGKVHLIFQPAEEGDAGALRMIQEGLFEKYPMDAVYGLHNWPYLPKGQIAVRAGAMMAASDFFEITIHGKGGHAAIPHNAIDPVPVAAQIILALQTLVSRSVDPLDSAVITTANISGGTGALNVIGDKVELNGSVRSFKPETRDMLERRIGEVAKGIAEAMGASVNYEYRRGYDATINDPGQTALCTEVAREVAGEENTLTEIDPCMGGEDFCYMARQIPACYIWMGQGESDPDSPHSQSCHHPGYDFNDSIIPLGVEYWVKLVEKALG